MTRIRQFAKDMGITYNKAKNLVQKGKKRRDGGSTVLENYMPIKIVAKKKEVAKPKPRPKNLKKKDPFRADKTESLNKKFSMETAKANEKAIKEIKKAMGGLKDVPPGNKGKGLSKLPTEVRNKMGFKKKGGTMKMMGGGTMNMMPRKLMNKGGVARGGGAATSGTGFKGVY